jgi:2-octaprenyl-6-methoxyphenol hydroxylase
MTPDYKIAILGGGPVGQTLALLLAAITREPERIALITRDSTPLVPADGSVTLKSPSGESTAPGWAAPGAPAAGTAAAGRPAPAADPRSLVLNYGSRVMLESLGAWPAGAAGIEHIHVSQRGRLGRVVIDNCDFNVPQLGYVVPYITLASTLARRVEQSGVTVLTGHQASVRHQSDTAVSISRGDHTVTSAIAVFCDGAAADASGTGGARNVNPTRIHRDYDQHALLTTVQATQPRSGWAFERFTQEGPLALLPLSDKGGTYSVVWCSAPARAASLALLNDAQFAAALGEAFGSRLGSFHSASPRHLFPLGLHARRELVMGRTVAIGNAAQTLHPVAGQGLNLGLRDAFQLTQALRSWVAVDAPAATALEAFARSRRTDRLLTAGLTDLMPRAFATGLNVAEHAGGLALMALDLCSPLRAPLARHLLYGHRG